MIKEQYIRTAMVLGEEAVENLSGKRVAVFGIGGVGSYCVEALARGGIGALDLVDHDRVSESNINRQLIADHTTVGEYKTQAAKRRIANIDPDCTVRTYETFFLPENRGDFDFSVYDYVVDCIDTVSGKIALIEEAKKAGVPVISAMGAGNKKDPTLFRVADIEKTSVCPLAKVMRQELRKRGIKDVKVVFSTEEVVRTGERTPGSLPFVPSVMGLIMAGEVIKALSGKK